MLYPKNQTDKLSDDLFEKPTSEYRAAPFWAWNSKLDKKLLLKEIEDIKAMGMGGFHIHPRSGLATRYLGKEYFDLVKACNNKAKEENMLCWLYDEDRWPSGAAGGFVTKDSKYRARYLVFTPKPYDDKETDVYNYDSRAEGSRNGKGRLLAKYEVMLKNGYLDSYRRLKADDVAKGPNAAKGSVIWYAYLEIASDNPWYNGQSYVNTLDPEAIKKFVEITHEAYYRELGDDFDKSIPAIFTDEPQFSRKETLGYAEEQKDIILPYTDDFNDTYRKAYGSDILDYLPELIWDLPDGKVSLARYRYHDHVSERFSSAFADTVGGWCAKHHIMLTGHMMEEPTLTSQTAALGEAMRSYRSFQLPGIDMLCDGREYSTAKQAQSAVHQYGRPGVTSELYGVTNWDFDFRGHKLGGDWQAALGVTVRVPHLTWVSMGGEAKRDYPASIGYQSPWYKEYPYIENHFARLNTALTRGKPHVKVGVIHPIESYWLHWGPREQTSLIREEMETNFRNIIEWLLFGLIDFDFISESLFPSLCEKASNPIKVGKMQYDVIIVPSCETLRSTTIDRLEDFAEAGGKLIFAGDLPKYADAKPTDKIINISKRSINIPFKKSALLECLEGSRDIDIRKQDGARSDNLFYQMRDDQSRKWLFICHVNKMVNPDLSSIENIEIRIKGKYKVTIYDTMTGEIRSCPYLCKNDTTIVQYAFSQHDSLLLALDDPNQEINQTVLKETKYINYDKCTDLPEPESITLSEPNALLLDMADYSFDGGEWQGREEVLRIDNEFRKLLKYPLRMGALVQPWVYGDEKEAITHKLKLKYTVQSDIDITNPVLALENAENTKIYINGTYAESKVRGYYVDEAIKTVDLPEMKKGINEIILEIPFGRKTNVEWCYLLGDFGVKVSGKYAEIISPVRNVAYGDWVNQGLPFYAGNVTYNVKVNVRKGLKMLEIPQFRNPVLSVSVDGVKRGLIALAPYKADLGDLDEGEHLIAITAYGNRVNTFGAVHNANSMNRWHGPDAWRTTGNLWSYEYQLRPTGVLISPRFWEK